MPAPTGGVTYLSPTIGYNSGSTKTGVSLNFTDSAPFYMDMGNGTYAYQMNFHLFSASSGGTDYGEISSYSVVISDDPVPFTANLTNRELDIPSGLSTGTYYVGLIAAKGGTRVAISVTGETSTITISFNANGGYGTTPSPITQEPGTSFQLPTGSTLYKNGYSFSTWNTSSAGTGTDYYGGLPYTLYYDDVLYAKWTANQYSIQTWWNGSLSNTYYYNTSTSSQDVYTEFGDDPVGRYFSYWHIVTQPSITISDYTNETLTIPANAYGNIVISAQLNYYVYDILYHLDNPTNDNHGNAITYSFNSEDIVFSQGSMYKTGYSFGGWYSDVNFINTMPMIASGSTEDKDVYVKWDLIHYTISYDLDNSTNNPSNPSTYNIEDFTITLLDPSKNYYDFQGWYTEDTFENEITEIISGSYGNISIYADFDPHEYTVSYVLDGGTNSPTNPVNYNVEDSTINLNSATKEGYTFMGWYTEDSFENQITSIAAGSHTDLTLYAKFLVNPYTIYFKNQDDSEIETKDMSFGDNITFTGDQPTYLADTDIRYVFIGWHTTKSSTVTLSDLGTVPVDGKTFYAIYDEYVSGIRSGRQDINIKIGETQVKAVYKGSSLIWEDFTEN